MDRSGNKKINSIKKISATIFTFLVLHNSLAQGAVLDIKNDDDSDLEVIIEAGEGGVLTTAPSAIKILLNGGQQKTIEVKKNQFDKETFSVTGKVRIPSMYNRCGSLLMDKDYKIIFTRSKAGGVICISEQLDK